MSNNKKLQRIREIFQQLLEDYDSAQQTVIWEYGDFGSDMEKHKADVKKIRSEVNQLLDSIDGRLTGGNDE